MWQRADGRYGAALSYDYYDPESGGKRRKRSSTTKATWDEAHEWLVGKQSDIRSGTMVNAENPTVEEFLAEWLSVVIEPFRSHNTYLKRRCAVGAHLVPAFGKTRLKDLDPRKIQSLYSRLARREPPLALSTRREIHVTLKMALSQAVRWNMLTRNPADLVDAPKQAQVASEDEETGEIRALTNQQAEALFSETVGSRWRNYYVAAIRTGLRPGEMLGLRWGDLALDTDLGSLRVRRSLDTTGGIRFNPPKSAASRRTLALHWEATEAFERQRELLESEGHPAGKRNLVFPSTSGTPMNSGNLRKRNLKPDLKQAELPDLTLHELRHTFASVMLHEWHVSPSIVSEMMGHASIKMTMDLYGHLFPGAQEDAIRALRKMHSKSKEMDAIQGT